MTFEPCEIRDVIHIQPDVHGDPRGYFLETFQQRRYAEAGLAGPWVQDNESSSGRGVLRGLHYQKNYPQGKLLRVIQGRIFDVAVDIRRGSPTFGRWTGRVIDGQRKNQLWIPPGMAHGFVVLSDLALVSYKCTDYYRREDERGILWSDPAIGIEWPIDPAELRFSDKDKGHPLLADADLP